MTIKVGMIGAGAIADDHCSTINRYSGAAMVAVAEINPERRDALKKKYSIPKAYERWQDLVADPDLDAVVIALPNMLHAPVSLAAIRAGKHVLLDKPFALNYAEARRVVDTARRSRKVLMLGMNQRYLKDQQILKALVERGELGEIYHAKAYWYRRMGAPKFGTWFVNKKLSGGGCMLDIGVHNLDLVLYLIDNWDPVSVSGKVYGKFGHRGIGEGGWGKSDRNAKLKFDVEDFATALIKFKNEATLDLNISWVIHQEQAVRNNVELYGTEAGASLVPLKLFRPAKRAGEYEVVVPQNVKVPRLRENRQFNWLDAILGKDKPLCSMEQSLVVQRILDAIYASSAGGREVRFR
ncbi:MAG: Gfo/Idh/MocA family oxidoreductase [Kiritimatiellae bacterium]|nr:Gfo/Idh/MocA family oxidoreductase [Kiritimatiellia bacterium]